MTLGVFPACHGFLETCASSLPRGSHPAGAFGEIRDWRGSDFSRLFSVIHRVSAAPEKADCLFRRAGQGSKLCSLVGAHTLQPLRMLLLGWMPEGWGPSGGVCAPLPRSRLRSFTPVVLCFAVEEGRCPESSPLPITLFPKHSLAVLMKSSDQLREFKLELQTVSSHLPSLLCGSSL